MLSGKIKNNSFYNIVVWLCLVASIVTCPVKKAVKEHNGVNTKSSSVYTNPIVSYNCSYNESDNIVNTVKKEIKNQLFVDGALSTNSFSCSSQPPTSTVTTHVFINGPPLYLRLGHIIV